MAIAARCIGARHAYLFIRGEYPLATQRLAAAIAEAEAANLLGEGIFDGSDFDFDIEIRRGAGAYICGEESALFEAIEGKRGFPRIKPPYPTESGLFGQPTTVNNVETLAAVPGILTHGAAWFRSLGTEGSSGSKLVSVSGHVLPARASSKSSPASPCARCWMASAAAWRASWGRCSWAARRELSSGRSRSICA